MKVLTTVFLWGNSEVGSSDPERDGKRWLLTTRGGKKTEPGIGSRISIQNFTTVLSISSMAASLDLQHPIMAPLSSSLDALSNG